MAIYRRISRNYCTTCKKNILFHHYSTLVNCTDPEDLVSFCCQKCFEYFITNTHKDDKLIENLLHRIPNIEDNKNGS